MGKWISVDDKKPRPKEPVIIGTIDLQDRKTKRVRLGRLKREYSLFGYSEHWEKFLDPCYAPLLNEEVIYWMEKPVWPD